MPGPVSDSKEWIYWCGFFRGELWVESESDEHCKPCADVEVLRLYLTELEARERFPFVAKVRLVLEDGK